MERTKLCTTSPTLSVVIPSCGSNASNSLHRWLARALFVHHRRSQRFLVLREDPFPHVSNICRRVVNMIFAEIEDKDRVLVQACQRGKELFRLRGRPISPIAAMKPDLRFAS